MEERKSSTSKSPIKRDKKSGQEEHSTQISRDNCADLVSAFSNQSPYLQTQPIQDKRKLS